MINNITNVDPRLQQQMNVAKAAPSAVSIPMPPILGFKTPLLKEKATLRTKKFRRGDNIIIAGEIDDDYVDIVEEDIVKEAKIYECIGKTFKQSSEILGLDFSLVKDKFELKKGSNQAKVKQEHIESIKEILTGV